MESVFFFACNGELCFSVFLDSKFTAVISAFGTYVVIHYRSTAVAASGELCFLQAVVRSSLGRSGLGESVFWMWHNLYFFICY